MLKVLPWCLQKCILKKVKLNLKLQLLKGKNNTIREKLKKIEIGTVIRQDISENQVNIAFLGIGSNLGSKKRNIEKTKFFLEKYSIKIIKSSNIYETYSWPNKNNPKFYNIVIKIITKLKPMNLFYIIKDIEKKIGRKKSLVNRPRVCDIDILDYRGQIYKLYDNDNKLIIPHPRLHNRNFVLFPLFEIEKNWKHPSKKTKIHDLIRKLDNSSLYSIKQI